MSNEIDAASTTTTSSSTSSSTSSGLLPPLPHISSTAGAAAVTEAATKVPSRLEPDDKAVPRILRQVSHTSNIISSTERDVAFIESVVVPIEVCFFVLIYYIYIYFFFNKCIVNNIL